MKNLIYIRLIFGHFQYFTNLTLHIGSKLYSIFLYLQYILWLLEEFTNVLWSKLFKAILESSKILQKAIEFIEVIIHIVALYNWFQKITKNAAF